MDDFSGKVAVITGAGSGIGRALALRCAGEGMAVVLADIEEPALVETAELVAAGGGADGDEASGADRDDGTAGGPSGATSAGEPEVLCVPTDVSNPQSVADLAAAAFDWQGEVHLLCNNAGVFVGGLMWERTLADWEWVLAVNLFGVVHAVEAFVPRLLEQDGQSHIVNTASMGGLVSASFSGPYFTSKFGVVGLSECLAHDLVAVGAGDKVGVSVLVPSLIHTNIGTSTRNRQESYANPHGWQPAASGQDIEQVLQASTADAGLDPDVAADKVLAAVRAGQFYIPTNDTYATQIAMRHEDQQQLRLPRVPPID